MADRTAPAPSAPPRSYPVTENSEREERRPRLRRLRSREGYPKAVARSGVCLQATQT